MNKVLHFREDTEFGLEYAINEFAKTFEIINVSYVYDSRTNLKPYKALVLYKSK